MFEARLVGDGLIYSALPSEPFFFRVTGGEGRDYGVAVADNPRELRPVWARTRWRGVYKLNPVDP